MGPRSVSVIRFGLFEFDPQAGELRKQGIRVRLQGQPVEILAMLLARPGELVTREELQKKLWPADTFIDFDPSLNAAVKRLRAALGDSAETPRFVETLSRRGYRFLAPVDAAPVAAPDPPVAVEPTPRGLFPPRVACSDPGPLSGSLCSPSLWSRSASPSSRAPRRASSRSSCSRLKIYRVIQSRITSPTE
jgi:DNA-binding winged helix-turn-helix (wHTH) protein